MSTLQNRIDALKEGDKLRHKTVAIFPPPKGKLGLTEGQYKYKPRGYPTGHDPVFRLICRTIREHQSKDMSVGAASLRVWLMQDGPALWPPSRLRQKLYAFKVYHDEEFPFTVPISLENQSGPLDADNLRVKIEGRWEPFKKWLVALPSRKRLYETSSYEANNSLQKWWSKNGKTFPIMKLPKEIRLLILQFVLGGNIYPMTIDGTNPRVVLGLGYPNRDGHDYASYKLDHIDYDSEAGNGTEPPNYAIFRVSKTLYHEAMTAGWVGTRKHFVNLYHFPDVLHNYYKKPDCNWLSSIKLSLTISGWFRLLGVFLWVLEPGPLRFEPASSSARYLKVIPGLKDLELHFRNPYDGRRSTPWGGILVEEFPCHKTIVDWILRFAYESIYHVPRVHLTGCIKTVTRQKWVPILERGYRERELPIEQHTYDYKSAVAYVLSFPWEALPPKCECKTSCKARRYNVAKPVGRNSWDKPPRYWFDRDDVGDVEYWKKLYPERFGRKNKPEQQIEFPTAAASSSTAAARSDVAHARSYADVAKVVRPH